MFDLSYWFIWLDFLTYVNQLKSFIEEYTRYTRNKMVEQAQFSDNRICSMKVIRDTNHSNQILFDQWNLLRSLLKGMYQTSLPKFFEPFCTYSQYICTIHFMLTSTLPHIFYQLSLCFMFNNEQNQSTVHNCFQKTLLQAQKITMQCLWNFTIVCDSFSFVLVWSL